MPVFLVDRFDEEDFKNFEIASKWNEEVTKGLYLDKVVVNPDGCYSSSSPTHWRVMVEEESMTLALMKGVALIEEFIASRVKERWSLSKIKNKNKEINNV
jgi:hypothetical protein